MIIGCDPGSRGGLAFLDNGELTLHVMPTFVTKNGKRNETHISVNKLEKVLIDELKYNMGNCKVYVEDIHSIFGTSASTNFKMGYNLGMVHSLLDRLFDDYFLVKPKVWQEVCWKDEDKVLKPTKRINTKATSLNAAKRIFPNESFIAPRGRTPHDGLFDAALIAQYGDQL